MAEIKLSSSDAYLAIDTSVNHGIGQHFIVPVAQGNGNKQTIKDPIPTIIAPIKLTISRIHYKKAIYKYGFIEIEMTVSNCSSFTDSTLSTSLKTYFFKTQKCISLVNENIKYIDGYYLADMDIKQDIVNGKHIAIVILKAYSPDYFLTLNKYSQVYRGKTLSKIIKSTLQDTFSGNSTILADRFTSDYLCHTTTKDGTKELKQPYLVQYNESFHDFVVRTANRCGELFYYEDGKLILGVDKNNLNDDQTEIKTSLLESILPEKVSFSMIPTPFQKKVVTLGKSYLVAGTDNMEKPGKGDLCYNQNIENADALHNTDRNSESLGFADMTGSHWMEIAHKALGASGIIDVLVGSANKASDIAITGGFLANGNVLEAKNRPGIQECEEDINNNFHSKVDRLTTNTKLTDDFKKAYEKANSSFFKKEEKSDNKNAFLDSGSDASKALKKYLEDVVNAITEHRNYKEDKKKALQDEYYTTHKNSFTKTVALTDDEIFAAGTSARLYIDNYTNTYRKMTADEIAKFKSDYETEHKDDFFKDATTPEAKEAIWEDFSKQPFKDLWKARKTGVLPTEADIKAEKEKYKEEHEYECYKTVYLIPKGTDKDGKEQENDEAAIRARIAKMIDDPTTELGAQYQAYLNTEGKTYDGLFKDLKDVQDGYSKSQFTGKTEEQRYELWTQSLSDKKEMDWKDFMKDEFDKNSKNHDPYSALVYNFEVRYKKQKPTEFQGSKFIDMTPEEKEKVWNDSKKAPAIALASYLENYQDESNFSNKYYAWIEKKEKAASESIQVHRLSNKQIPTQKLGEYYTLPNEGAGLVYLVNQVEVDIYSNTDENTHNIDASIALSRTETDNLREDKKYQQQTFPPLSDIPHIRKSEPQIAIVSDVADPQRAGRVQITYPWSGSEKAKDNDGNPILDTKDKEGKSSSPWIPVLVPFTGLADSGFLMTPDKGNLVMINYEGGNIERPFVDGSLFCGKACTSWGSTPLLPVAQNFRSSKHAITYAGNGITFAPGNAGGFVGSMLPNALSNPLNKCWGKDNPLVDGNMKFGGGLTLSDYYGTYSISMSSAGRSINIDSPWGTVGINAFTGITLSAPNGDIKIAGKNVTIEAGNNITLTSGKNIKSKHVNWAQELANAAATIAGNAVSSVLKNTLKARWGVDIGKLVDISFVRNVWEIVCRPVEGSLTMESKRNVIVQAGGGKVVTPSDTMSSTPKAKKSSFALKSWSSIVPKSNAQTEAEEKQAYTTLKHLDLLGTHYFTCIDIFANTLCDLSKTFESRFNQFVADYFTQKGKKVTGKLIKEGFCLDTDLIAAICDKKEITKPKEGELKDWIYYPNFDYFPGACVPLANPVIEKMILDYNALLDTWNAIREHLGLDNGSNKLLDSFKKHMLPGANNFKKTYGFDESTLQNALPSAIAKSEDLHKILNLPKENHDLFYRFYASHYLEQDLEGVKKILKKLAYCNIVYMSDRFSTWTKDKLTGIEVQGIKKVPKISDLKNPVKWKEYLGSIYMDKTKESTVDGYSVLGNFLKSAGLSDLASYNDSSKEWSFLNSMQNTFNINGKSGPRAFWDVSANRGAILMSGKNKVTYCIGRSAKACDEIPNPKKLGGTLNVIEKL